MSDPRGRFAATALGAACLAVGVTACSEPAATALPSDAAAPTTAAPTPAPTSVPPPPRSAPTRTSTPRSTPSPGARPTPSPAPKPGPAPPPPPPPPPQSGTDAYESQILALVNAERSAAGLRPLTAQTCPDGFAEPWSPHMAAEGRLSHQSLNPVLSRCGGHAAAENVGMNSSAWPGDMVAGFMGSPPHRANILNGSYTGIGIGAYRDAHGVWWVTQDFVG